MFRHLTRILVLVLAAGIGCAILVRYAPGAMVDERELNRHLGEESIRALKSDKARGNHVAANLLRYFAGLAKGDLGYSESNQAPIAQLIADRAPETLRELALGLTGGWLLGLAFALPRRGWLFSPLAIVLLSLPTALIAYLCLMEGAKPYLVMVIVLTPRIFRFTRNLLAQAYTALHIEMARARGIGEVRILFQHVLPSISPQLSALAAASVSIAIGVSIPLEAICDAPGIGRLAWNAAMARDLPLLVNVTMIVAVATTVATAASEMANPQ